MKVGLLGGSFNPAHQGHIYISDLAIKKLKLNQVWWIPTAHNPLKDKSVYEPFKSRLATCKEITKNHPKIRIKNFEKNSIVSFELVKKILARRANHSFYWIMGADSLHEFHLWDHYKKLMKLVEIVVFSRGKFLLKARKTRCFKVYKKINIPLTPPSPSRGEGEDLSRSPLRKNGARVACYLPKISLFKTKNHGLSSTEIRNKSNNC
jgi:nicotinate-nucleotide adenylyltransferase